MLNITFNILIFIFIPNYLQMFRSSLFSFSLLIFVLMLFGEEEFTRDKYSLLNDFSCFKLSSIFLQNISRILFLVTKHITYSKAFPFLCTSRAITPYDDLRIN